MANILCALSFLLVYGSGVASAALLEIKTSKDAMTPQVVQADEQALDNSEERAKDLVSHVREEWTKAGCPSLWNGSQCERLLSTFVEVIKYAGPSGASASVNVMNSTFINNGKE